MAIPLSQLETWSHQGAIQGSSTTYNTIKNVLQRSTNPYAGKDYNVFLQGSYCNDTNIYAESDVDIVIKLNDAFQSDLTLLKPEDLQAWNAAFSSNATYTYSNFKTDVIKVLSDEYSDDVTSGDKAIMIEASGNRRKADVITAIEFRRYFKFNTIYDQNYVSGICFWDSKWNRIANYPKQHSENMTKKHQSSGCWLKPMVRILKNMRTKLVDGDVIEGKIAPSYYIEGLLYNVPDEKFTNDYEDCFVNAINWIQQDADKSKLLCANEQYYLLWENSPTSWPKANCEAFLKAITDLWNNW
jgi:hypothetical protein